jgi:cytochrome c551/c552
MSTMKPALWLVALFAAAVVQEAVAADPPPSLTHHRCYICHSDQEALVGPAFADIAAAYRGRKDAVDRIAKDIRAGVRSGGPWHMPPHPEISPSEARAMARYIMSLSPGGAKARPVAQSQ